MPLTPFITGRYCFHRLPFGNTLAPEHFQRRMSEIVGDIEGLLCLLDNFLVYGSTQEEHDAHLTRVLRRLREEGPTLNTEKCRFSQNQVQYLVDENGIRPDP